MMWQKLSLRSRLSLLLALVLALGLAINITRLVLEAGPRVQAEDQSVIRLAREFIETLVVGLNETPDAEARLGRIVGDLNRLRHVSITLRHDGAKAEPPANDGAEVESGPQSVPGWFVALVHPEKTAVNVPITVNGKPASLLITSHPDDEMAEIWDGIVDSTAGRLGDRGRSVSDHVHGCQPGAGADRDAVGGDDPNRIRPL